MKKTIFILTTRYLHHYGSVLADQANDYQFVLVAGHQEIEKLSDEQHALFAKTVAVDSTNDDEVVPALDYNDTLIKIIDVIADFKLPESTFYFYCCDEGNLEVAGRLRRVFKVPGMTFKHAQVLTNKVLMKSVLEQHQIRVPKHLDLAKVAATEALQTIETSVGLPAIIKPKSSAASSGVALVHTQQELDIWLEENHSQINRFEAEEYIEATIYHCDTQLCEGKVVFEEVGEYQRPPLELKHGVPCTSIILPKDEEVRAKILAFNKDVLAALEQTSGTFHHELFVTNSGEIIFLEIAGRLPGGITIPTYKKFNGVNLAANDFNLQIGLPVEASTNNDVLYTFGADVPVKQGRVTAITPPAETEGHEHELKYYVEVGQEFESADSLNDLAATLLVWSTDYHKVRQLFDQVDQLGFISYE